MVRVARAFSDSIARRMNARGSAGDAVVALDERQQQAGPSHFSAERQRSGGAAGGVPGPVRNRNNRPRGAVPTQFVDLTADNSPAAVIDDGDVVVVSVKPGVRRLRTPVKRPRAAPAGQAQGQPAQPAQPAQSAQPAQPAQQQSAWPAWVPLPPQPPAQVAPPSPEARKCPVCLDKMEQMASTPCGHVFCHQCLQDCLKATKKCPKCRKSCTVKQIHRIYLD